MQTLIQWGPLLLCPLMMLFCLVPMLRGKGKHCAATQDTTALQPAQIRQRIDELQREELALQERLLSQHASAAADESPISR